MRPDPEQERAMQESVGELFQAAPKPDVARLEMALNAARARQRRSRKWKVGLLIGAMLLAGGAATAAWWASRDQSAGDPPDPSQGVKPVTKESTPAAESGAQQHDGADSSADEAPGNNRIIYQRAD